MGRAFIIKTDQKSLKHLLEQKLSTPFQQFWLSKLMGFDYVIQYKSGSDNLVADALSRVSSSSLLLMAISSIQSDLMGLIEQSWTADSHLQGIIQQKQQDATAFPKYQLINGQLRRKGKLVVKADDSLKAKLLHWVHSSTLGGHSGRDATLKKLKQLFYWKGMHKSVQNFLRQCTICLVSYTHLTLPTKRIV